MRRRYERQIPWYERTDMPATANDVDGMGDVGRKSELAAAFITAFSPCSSFRASTYSLHSIERQTIHVPVTFTHWLYTYMFGV